MCEDAHPNQLLFPGGSMRSVRSRLLVILAVAVSLVVPGTTASAAGLDVIRVSGADRYATAAAVSQAAWPAGAPIAFVATGRDFADALAIAAVGGAGGPVLLTEPGALPKVTADELRRLDPSSIVLVGGPRAVSDAVQRAIARNATGTSVAVGRIAGPDRYATAVEIGRAFLPDADLVYLTDGHASSASLVAAAAVGHRDGVLLTTARGTLPSSVAAELARRRPAELVVVGDVSTTVVNEAARYATTTRRITAGNDVDLAVAVSRDLWASTQDVLLASAADFPDALAAAAWAVSAGVPLLLTNPKVLEDATACEVLRLDATGAVVTGGSNAVSNAVADELRDGISPFAHGCEGSAVVQIPDPDPRTEEVEVTLYEMTTSPDSKRAYVVNNQWNSVEVIDLVEGTWLGRIAVGSDPVDLDLTADGKRLYVMNNGSQTISIIDTTKPFDRAEVATVAMLGAGTNSRRNYAIEGAADGKLFIIPGRLSNADTGCLQVMDSAGNITELEPGRNPNIPISAKQLFRSTDGRLVGVIAPDRGPEVPDAPETCRDQPTPAPSPSPTASPSPTPSPTATPSPTPSPTPSNTDSEAKGDALYTYVNGTWKRIGSWGRAVADIAYGAFDENGITTDGSNTTTVFDAADRAIVLGTITSDSGSSFGLAVEPLQPNCPKNRGNPAVCTQRAYNVVQGGDGLGAVDVLDMTEGLNVQGSFRVVDRFPLRTPVGGYGGTNQPTDASLQNQVTITPDATRLVVATEFAVEIFPIR